MDGDWLVASLGTDPTGTNWVVATDRPTLQIGGLVADSLVDHGLDLTYRPRLAAGWELSDDRRVLTFRLQRDVRWHDGRPFTADDVLFTYRLAVDPATGARRFLSYFSEVTEVRAPDAWTVEVTYRRPFSPALQGWEALLILPRHRWEGRDPRDSPENRLPVGTGPFRLVEWQAGRQVVLEANRDHWAGRPHLDRIVFRIIPDRHTSFEALRAGEVDLTQVSPADWPTVRALPGDGRLEFLRYHAQNVVFIAWNGDGSAPFFDDARVRRAMTLALDRRGYVATVLHGLGRIATSTFVPGTWAHDLTLEPLPFDPEEAARLLDEVGWIDGDGDGLRERDGRPFRFTLGVFQNNPSARQLALLLQDSLRRIGVRVEIEPLELAAFLERLHTRRFEAQISSWGLDIDPDPFDFWHSSQARLGANYAGFADPEVDRLCEEGRATFDPVRRAALYARVQRLLQRDQPFTFVYHPEQVVGRDRRLHGVRAAPTGIWRWYPSTLEWWVPAPLQRYPLGRSGDPGA